jgi:hypothetical protein
MTSGSFYQGTMRVDGVFPGGTRCGSGWIDGDVAGNCLDWVTRSNGFGSGIVFRRLTASDIGLDQTPGPNWSYNHYSFQIVNGTMPTDDQYYLRAVLTHELGHGVELIDLNCELNNTMCGNWDTGVSSWYKASLESDDITSANYVYQP